MRHAVLGVGGVGGLIAALLAKSGEDVTLVLRPEAMDVYPDRLTLESPFGSFTVDVSRTVMLAEEPDVIWVTVKATQLDAALQRVPPRLQTAAVVPLLNGIDHIRYLRKSYGHDAVVPATIAVETERVAPGHIVHRSPFARLNVASMGESRLRPAIDKLASFGMECRFVPNEDTLLWSKLVFLAPLALVSTASGLRTGEIASDPQWRSLLDNCIREACNVAATTGARVNLDSVLQAIDSLPPNIRSSMQKDVAAGRPPEIDAIAGPIVRGAEAHGISAVTTRELVEMVQRKIEKQAHR
jgi:2-dehydropantoate 2-reductase